ncbi:MAG: MBOAT family protein [Kiritimatiellae bacterium]|nr:MBOAT family protein [Kiritimatiellia bacterium]
MIFTSFVYIYFFLIVLCLYWLVRNRAAQNLILLIASYVFYGWVHPWFCCLMAASTVLDYVCGLGMERHRARKRWFVVASLAGNLALLGFFKYFNFFTDNVHAVLSALGLAVQPAVLRVFLPVGISFYTFQTLSYTLDIYRGSLKPRTNFLDFALFVAFFPQLVAGPIERAARLLPQMERERKWDGALFGAAWPLLIRGYLKKLVIADNVAVFSDQVFMLSQPSLLLLSAGTLAFALQIYADFSAYTDIARGSARLFGFELMENFDSPYLSISPSDFWRRWHISFSSWIRDYLYIALGGSRVRSMWRYALVVVTTMGLSGLWHGAAWHFVVWGLYHGVLVFAYHLAGMGGRWRPKGIAATAVAWTAMSFFTLFGWVLFRAPSMGWIFHAFAGMTVSAGRDALTVTTVIACYVALYSAPLLVLMFLDRLLPRVRWAHSVAYGLALAAITCFATEAGQDFIYFQF